MPTAAEYDSIASGPEGAADDVEAHVAASCRSADTSALSGGTGASLVVDAVEVSRLNAELAAAQLRLDAAEARRRAAVCREYERAMAAFERAQDVDAVAMQRYVTALATSPSPPFQRPWPTAIRPTTPASWVDLP